MEIKFKTSELKKELAIVGAFRMKGSLSSVDAVLIASNGDSVFFYATNLDVTVSKAVQFIESDGPVNMLIPGDALNVINKLSGEEVTFKASGMSAEVKSGKSRYKINLADPEAFPGFTPGLKENASAEFTTTAERLKADFDAVRYCAAGNDEKALYQTVFVDNGPEGTFFTSTDKHRIARIRESYEVKRIRDGKFLIHANTAGLLSEVLSTVPAESEVNVESYGNSVFFNIQGITIQARTIDAKFPEVTGLFSEATLFKIGFDADEFADAAGRAMKADAWGNIDISFGRDIKITAAGESLSGEELISSDFVPALSESGEERTPPQYRLSAKLLLDYVNRQKGKKLFFFLTDKEIEKIVVSVKEDKNNFEDGVFLIMPRIRG